MIWIVHTNLRKFPKLSWNRSLEYFTQKTVQMLILSSNYRKNWEILPILLQKTEPHKAQSLSNLKHWCQATFLVVHLVLSILIASTSFESSPLLLWTDWRHKCQTWSNLKIQVEKTFPPDHLGNYSFVLWTSLESVCSSTT